MKSLRRFVPTPVKDGLRWTWLLALDAADVLLGRRPAMVPPRRLMFVGHGDFLETGREFLGHFIRLAGLKPDESVLDVGCGIGRMAIPLTAYLSPSARYEGFDIVPAGVDWCRRRISTRFPNFRFQLADIRNKRYNPRGRLESAHFVFPFGSAEFDFAFMTSVFTHMFPLDVEHYLAETARVLKPGGRCLATFFVLNSESRRLMANGMSALQFDHEAGGCFTIDPQIPERALAYDEAWVLERYAAAGLAVEAPIRYGAWSGRLDGLSYQDIVVARRP